jgi:hypothetical protein
MTIKSLFTKGNVVKLSVKATTDLALAVLPLNPLKGTLPFLEGYKCESKSPLGDLGVKNGWPKALQVKGFSLNLITLLHRAYFSMKRLSFYKTHNQHFQL